MCYITRRIFPCCGQENWYSEPIPQQCIGTPRCSSAECIILQSHATLLRSGRCWRCILGDMKRGVRTGVSDRVLREAQRIAEQNEVSKAVSRRKEKGMVGNGGKKRKREAGEDDRTGLGDEFGGMREGMREEQKYAKKRKGWDGHPRLANANNRAPPPQMPYTPPETPKWPPDSPLSWMNELLNPASAPYTPLNGFPVDQSQYLQQPPINTTSNDLMSNPSRNPEQQNLDFDTSQFPDMKIDRDLLAKWIQENQDFAFDPDLFQDKSIDPKLLMNWVDAGITVPENSDQDVTWNDNWSGDQNTALNQQSSSRLPASSNQNLPSNMQFTGQWLDVNIAQDTPTATDFKEIKAETDQEQGIAIDPASIPLGDPMQFRSDLGSFDDFVQWPDFDPSHGETGLSAAEMEEQSRQELDDILFGNVWQGEV